MFLQMSLIHFHCFRAETLLKNINRLQREQAPLFGKDIGMGIKRRPLDLLNTDKNWAVFVFFKHQIHLFIFNLL